MENKKTYDKTFNGLISASASLLTADAFGGLKLSKYQKLKLLKFCEHLERQIYEAEEIETTLVKPKRKRPL